MLQWVASCPDAERGQTAVYTNESPQGLSGQRPPGPLQERRCDACGHTWQPESADLIFREWPAPAAPRNFTRR